LTIEYAPILSLGSISFPGDAAIRAETLAADLDGVKIGKLGEGKGAKAKGKRR
jgi:hypothetical protein